jgi:hypothetical protein
LEGFAQQAGIGRRAVFAELKLLADRIGSEGKRLADLFAGNERHRIIVLRIGQVIADRARKASYLMQGAK